MHIHTVNLSREQGSLVSACARADLHNNVLVIVGVFRQKQNLQGVLQLLDAGLRFVQLLFEHLAHFLIVLFFQHHKTLFHSLFTLFVFLISIDDRLQITLLLHQLPETLLITDHVRLIQLVHDILVTQKQVIQLVKHACSSIKILSIKTFHDPVKSGQVLYYLYLCEALLTQKLCHTRSLIAADFQEKTAARP